MTPVAKRPPATAESLATDLLTVAELALLLRLTTKGVYSLVENRRIPYVKVSNRVRFLRSDVLEWLRENRVPASEGDR